MSTHRPSPSESGDGNPPPPDRTDNSPGYTEPDYGDTRSASQLPNHSDSGATRPIPTGSDSRHRGSSEHATPTDRDGDGVRDDDEHEHRRPVPTTADRDRDGIPDRDERQGDAAVLPAVSQQREAEARRREEFGGFNIGADFFGWLVAVALTILLASIVGAIAAAVGESLDVNRTDAEQQAGTFGLATAIALLVVLMIAYYAGGYVAGRMSRYDGGRQGMGVWLIGLLVTLIAVGVGYISSEEYNIFDRVNLPTIPIPSDTLTSGGLITLVTVLVGTLLAAFAGGKVGQRYHSKINRVGLQDDRH